MATDSAQIVQKLWNYRNVLRDDGMSSGDYPSTRLRTGPSAKLPSAELRAGRTGPSTVLTTGVEELTKSRTLETDGSEIEAG